MAYSYNEGACHEDRDYTYELAELDSVMSLSSVLKIQVVSMLKLMLILLLIPMLVLMYLSTGM